MGVLRPWIFDDINSYLGEEIKLCVMSPSILTPAGGSMQALILKFVMQLLYFQLFCYLE